MVLTLWKDIPYSTALLGLTFLVLLLVQSRGNWIARRGNWIIVGCVGVLAALFRHNGLPVVLACSGLLFLAYPRQWRSWLLAIALGAGLYLGIRGPLYRWLQVEKSTVLLEATTSMYTMAAQAEQGTELDVLFDSIQLSGNWGCSLLPRMVELNEKNNSQPNINIGQKAINRVTQKPLRSIREVRSPASG